MFLISSADIDNAYRIQPNTHFTRILQEQEAQNKLYAAQIPNFSENLLIKRKEWIASGCSEIEFHTKERDYFIALRELYPQNLELLNCLIKVSQEIQKLNQSDTQNNNLLRNAQEMYDRIFEDAHTGWLTKISKEIIESSSEEDSE